MLCLLSFTLLAPSFFSFLKAEYLLVAALSFMVITLIIVTLIFINLYRKQVRAKIKDRVGSTLEQWLCAALLETTSDSYKSYITPTFLRYLKHQRHRQYAIDQLIVNRKNLTGSIATNIVMLYEALGLKADSLKKINSRVWHKKAKGIYELYMMNQVQMQDRIQVYANSKNEYVRMEAQTALIGFMGFEGLSFLDTLTEPITNWQQIKLLEQLRPLDLTDMPNLHVWLRSTNEYVVLFALRLAEIYQQSAVYEEVVDCLASRNEKIRLQAILTLVRIPTSDTASVLIVHYPHESTQNKKHILKGLAILATDDDLDFLLNELDNEDEGLKLEAAAAISKCTKDGISLIKDRAVKSAYPFQSIYLHVENKLPS